MGTQDDFAYATRFLADFELSTPTMLWDPSFATWQTLGVRTNSSMAMMTANLDAVSSVWFGFDDTIQGEILEQAAEMGPNRLG